MQTSTLVVKFTDPVIFVGILTTAFELNVLPSTVNDVLDLI